MTNKRNGNFYLPQELVVDILLRLPVKDLSLCKCVSKNWCSLIESSSFVRQHFESSQERLLIRLLKNQDVDKPVPEHEEPEVSDEEIAEEEEHYGLSVDGMFSEYEEPFHLQIPYEALYVRGPLNGVFCVVTRFPRGPMALVNPALRQFKPLPLVQCIDPPPPQRFQYDEFGMGLDPLTGDFKLVLLRFFYDKTLDEDQYTCVVYVCTSDSDSWRVVEDAGSINSRRLALPSRINTYMNGSYYWLLDGIDESDTADEHDEILAFDMGTEKFREIRVATGDSAIYVSWSLYVYRDTLAMVKYDHISSCFEIWLMVTEECWIKSSRVGPFEGINRPLCLFKNNILFETKTGFLTQYDISTQESKTFSAKRIDGWPSSHWVYVYKESLVSIKGNAGKCKLWDPSSDLVMNFFKDSTSALQEPIAG